MLNSENESVNTPSVKYSIKFEQDIDKAKNIEEKAEILLELGLIEAFRKNYDKAIDYIEKSQKIYNELKNIKKIATCLAELAIIYYKNCNDRLIRSLTL